MCVPHFFETQCSYAKFRTFFAPPGMCRLSSGTFDSTDSLTQPSPDHTYIPLVVAIDNTPLLAADTFCYLGSCIHRTGSIYN